MNLVTYLAEIRRATIDARKRTGDEAIGTECERGQFRVVRHTFAGRRCIVTPLSPWGNREQTAQFLDAL